jgi:hypothetical protein
MIGLSAHRFPFLEKTPSPSFEARDGVIRYDWLSSPSSNRP